MRSGYVYMHNVDDLGVWAVMNIKFELDVDSYITVLTALGYTLSKSLEIYDKDHMPEQMTEMFEYNMKSLKDTYDSLCEQSAKELRGDRE